MTRKFNKTIMSSLSVVSVTNYIKHKVLQQYVIVSLNLAHSQLKVKSMKGSYYHMMEITLNEKNKTIALLSKVMQ